MTEPANVWHALCAHSGKTASCNGCARNPGNQPEAIVTSQAQNWSIPLIRSDGRCADWMAIREPRK